jgi:hypothetical protein
MNFLPTSLTAVVLALAVPTALQTGGEKPVPPPAAPARPVAVDQMLGAWRLTNLESTNMRREKREEVGYLLIAESFLSLECHIGWMDDSGARAASTFFSGTHEYELRNDGVLVLTSLIGATVDPNASIPVFEPVGRRREYRVKFNGAKLVLTRDKDQQTFEFERIASSGGGLDFYGRRKQPPKPTTPPKDEEKKDGEKE